jgi:hypothetical protein
MASNTGQVQRIFMDPGAGNPPQVAACIFIGPTPANVEILLLRRQAADPPHTGAFYSSMLDALAQALTSRREVTVTHNDNDSYIYAVELR